MGLGSGEDTVPSAAGEAVGSAVAEEVGSTGTAAEAVGSTMGETVASALLTGLRVVSKGLVDGPMGDGAGPDTGTTPMAVGLCEAIGSGEVGMTVARVAAGLILRVTA